MKLFTISKIMKDKYTLYACPETSSTPASRLSLRPPQFWQDALSKNDTVLQFSSPEVNSSYDTQSLRIFLQLDNVIEELKSFDYHPDPTFNELAKNIITETSIIIVTVRTDCLQVPLVNSLPRYLCAELTLLSRSVSGSGFLQGDDSQRGPGVCGRRLVSRKHPAGKHCLFEESF